MEEATAGLLRDKSVEAAEAWETGVTSKIMRRILATLITLTHTETILRLVVIFFSTPESVQRGGLNFLLNRLPIGRPMCLRGTYMGGFTSLLRMSGYIKGC
jgi:hypothetical protein